MTITFSSLLSFSSLPSSSSSQESNWHVREQGRHALTATTRPLTAASLAPDRTPGTSGRPPTHARMYARTHIMAHPRHLRQRSGTSGAHVGLQACPSRHVHRLAWKHVCRHACRHVSALVDRPARGRHHATTHTTHIFGMRRQSLAFDRCIFSLLA